MIQVKVYRQQIQPTSTAFQNNHQPTTPEIAVRPDTSATKMPAWNPDKDIPSLASNVILITGGTAGLGSGSISELAKHAPAHIIFTGRNQQSADALIKKQSTATPNVKVTFIRCDISSFASIATASDEILAQISRLDIVMLNAGVMAVDAAVSVDGYEIQMMTNHLGHALLIRRLLPILQQTATTHGDARVINLTSVAYTQAPKLGIDFATLKTPQENQGGLIPGGKYPKAN
ncbi:hypothetical protein LTR78_008038 [Recurvomyces mirabilis]|uniref:Oxidoreductase n=1 Tax=Recurvomyces mirabilis TaxID=574656 RepID=A0AAE0TV15_9PEZI|nr:hypothetical protein LTR78_008038 [Recurvomyces mirabilis]KAK5150766.1 hypothetical protein LTS14_009829 [Recurvomyces mirabilis]